ncbi:unnamed protein product, partial [Ascophyllum nodosum]
QVLEEAARRIEEDTPWYEKLGLAFEESEGVGEVTVEMVLASNVTQGLIEAASKTVLAPAFEVLKGLIGAVQDAAKTREEVLELIKYCVGISKCVVDAAKRDQLPSYMITKLEEFQCEMEAVKKFVEAFGAQTGFIRKMLSGSRHRSTAAKHKSNLQDILNAVIIHIVDTNRVVNTIAKTLEDRDPSGLNDVADIPSAVPSLPKAYVERTAMQEEAVSGLVNEERNATATVSLWGMGGGGKTVLASSVVRDDRVRSSFRHGMFWFHFGQEGKISVALILGQLARDLAVAPTDTPHLCPNKFDSADEAARHVSATIISKNLRCLVVLDNVWDVEVVSVFANTGIHVLVTTRERTVILPMYRGVMVEVGDMEEEEGLELLRKASHAYGPLPTEAKQVADDCSMLPLALSMAGAMAKDQPLDASSWRTLHETLQEKDFKLEEMRSEEMTSQRKSIFST